EVQSEKGKPQLTCDATVKAPFTRRPRWRKGERYHNIKGRLRGGNRAWMGIVNNLTTAGGEEWTDKPGIPQPFANSQVRNVQYGHRTMQYIGYRNWLFITVLRLALLRRLCSGEAIIGYPNQI